jgi:hypothetical protein
LVGSQVVEVVCLACEGGLDVVHCMRLRSAPDSTNPRRTKTYRWTWRSINHTPRSTSHMKYIVTQQSNSQQGDLKVVPISSDHRKLATENAPVSTPRKPDFHSSSSPRGHFSLPAASVSGRYPADRRPRLSVQMSDDEPCATCNAPVRVLTCLRGRGAGLPILEVSMVEVILGMS